MKKEPEWAKYITEDNLPNEEMKYLASIIGFEATKKLMLEYQGFSIDFPKKALSKYKNQYIVDTYDGTNKSRKQLVLKCQVTERYIYKLVKDKIEGKK